MVHLLALMTAFLCVGLLVSGLKPVAVQVGLVDRPGGRKQHRGEIPLVGGLAMFSGFAIVSMVLFAGNDHLHALLIGASILVVTGLIDDRRELSPVARFAAQTAAVLAMIFGAGVVVRDLGDLLFVGTLSLGYGAALFTIVGVVGAINAVNMSDGLDGLAGSLALVMVLALIVIAWGAGLGFELNLLLTLAFTILGFLVFNLRTPWQSHARVFMGDAGSMFLGFVLAWFVVHLSQGPARAMAPVTALWIFALPLLDTLTVMARRLRNGVSPFKSDREHLHHLLLRAGFGVSQTVGIITLLAASLAVIGVAGDHVGMSEGAMFAGFAAMAGVYVLGIKRVRRMVRVPVGAASSA